MSVLVILLHVHIIVGQIRNQTKQNLTLNLTRYQDLTCPKKTIPSKQIKLYSLITKLLIIKTKK